jgi:hypothetical protein
LTNKGLFYEQDAGPHVILSLYIALQPTGFGQSGSFYYIAPSMKETTTAYSISRKASAILMAIALLWLTVSLPVVYAAQQQLAGVEMSSDTQADNTEDDTANPYGNNTEGKAPSTTVSEEYLHDHHKSDYFYSIISRMHKFENADAYTAFHGEVQVPPPNRA